MNAAPATLVKARQLSTLLSILATYQSLARTEGRIDWLEQYAHRASLAPTAAVDPPSRLVRGISLDAVSYAYGDAPPVLRDLSLHLDAGSVVALVGENGAGKTTLVKLLCSLYVPASGRISVDGIDLSRIPRGVWQQRAAACFQDYQQFELLLREAIGVGDLPRMEDVAAIQAACERAGVDFVEQLPRGFDTQLGAGWPGGVELSGGQWQRVAIARGFMRQSPLLLVLDEPAASLDAHAEHALFERVAGAVRSTAGQGRVTILVTHRFSTVRMADVIHVLEAGRIVESGDHATLMGKGGRYAELFEMQAAGYR